MSARPRCLVQHRCLLSTSAFTLAFLVACGSAAGHNDAPTAPQTPVAQPQALTTLSVMVATVQAGQTTTAVITALDQHGATMTVGVPGWTTSTPSIATISASGVVTAIAAEVSQTKVKTFTARFEGHQGFDEGPYARMVAEHLGTEHTELPTPPASAELLVELARQFDDPIADSSMIPTCLISREIRKHATVAIGGDGGDELFGGYKRYPALIAQERLRASIPSPLLKLLPSVFRMLPERMPGRGTAAALAGNAGAGVQFAGLMFRADERVALSPVLEAMSSTALHRPELLRTKMAVERTTMLQRATAIDFGSYMVDDVLVKVDRASMLASLEVRAPFLDPQLIAFAFTGVPDRFRATRQDRKVVLRALGQRLLPPALDLTRKQGFTIPMDAWMRGAWAPLLNDRASAQGMLVSSSALGSLTTRLQNGEALGERLFSMLFLRLWEKEYRIQDVV